MLFLLLVSVGFFGHLPTKEELTEIKNNVASVALDRNGEKIGRYFVEDRTLCPYDSIPPFLIEALVATEDSRFFEHSGVDYRAYALVLWKNLVRGDRDQGGGSTLHQQLIKNVYGREPLGYGRVLDLCLHKVREGIAARRLHRVMSKEEILEHYLNTVSFPGNSYGVTAASRRLFNKRPAALSRKEAVALVASLKGTSLYDPIHHPGNNEKRSQLVLQRMMAEGYLNPDEAVAIQRDSLTLDFQAPIRYLEVAPHFTNEVLRVARDIVAEIPSPWGRPYNILTDNLRIYTTLDLRVQQHAEVALEEHMSKHQRRFERHLNGRSPWATDYTLTAAILASDRWASGIRAGKDSSAILAEFEQPYPMELLVPNGEPRRGNFTPLDSIAHYLRYLRAGFLVTDHQTGGVVAWVGGRDYGFSQYDHVTSRRQTGSTYKAFVYAAALRAGYSPCFELDNELKTYGDDDGAWVPRNASGEYGGAYTMHGALTNSINTAAVQMTLQVGAQPVAMMAASLGVPLDDEAVPSIALGTSSASLYSMTGAYAAFANGGQYAPPHLITRIETRSGEVIYRHRRRPKQALTEVEATLMLKMLRNVVDEGTGARLRWEHRVSFPAAGKTGTTQNMADGWFVGSTPGLTAGAWVGGASTGVRFRYGRQGNGSRAALPIWAQFVRRMERDSITRPYLGRNFPPPPARVNLEFYCPQFYPPEPDSLMAQDSINWERIDPEVVSSR
nr:transglycosylase domain-containing protein [Lewinella sp. W8]